MKKVLLVLSFLLTIIIVSSCAEPKDDVLRVAMDLRYPPFETVTTKNEPQGISVDIAFAFGDFLGRDVEIVNTDFGSIISALQSGEVDIAIASMSITDARKLEVSFSDPYFYFKIISLVNKDFANVNDLTPESTVEDILAISNTKFVGIATQVSVSIPESYNKEVVVATDLGTAVEAIAQGTSDILLMSANPVVDGHKANLDKTIVIWDAFIASPIGMATKLGNDELIEQANLFIATFNEPKGLYEILAQNWDHILLEQLGRGLSFYKDE